MEKQITVLIAENHRFMRDSLREILSEMEDVTCSGEARNGEEAIQLAEELCPDIILMDINMSPVNGFEATRKILKQNPSIRIIGLSMHREVSYCKNLMRLGAKGFVIKNFAHEEVIEAIIQVAAGGKFISKELRDQL